MFLRKVWIKIGVFNTWMGFESRFLGRLLYEVDFGTE